MTDITTRSTDRRSLVKASLAAAAAGTVLSAGAARAAGAQDGQRFTYAYKSDIQTLDPMLTTDTTTQNVYHQMFEMLVQMGRDGQFEGVLAESWEAVDDVTWRFTLRQGVTFHNGEPFNADAVVFSLERLRNEELASPGAPGATPIDSITKVDDYTVDVITAGTRSTSR
jgi:peptide/nickel transport system substrate-binding protein